MPHDTLADKIPITFRIDPDAPDLLRTNHSGPRWVALRDARRLRRELRDVHPRAVVLVNGVQLPD